MAVTVTRDFEADEVVIAITRGMKAGGFARFLEAAADALEHGKLLPTNPDPRYNVVRGADEIRRIAAKIHGHNDA